MTPSRPTIASTLETRADSTTTETDVVPPVSSRAQPDWWRRAVVYQIYPRSFADSDGDGIGDLRGIIGKLDYLQRLGVDVLWLSPVYRSPQRDNGYDISDYRDIDPTFGTLAVLDELIADLHARGMKLVMDLVVNHTSNEHPWFLDSRSARRSAKRDFYIWRPPRPGHEPGTPGAEPNNWGAAFGGPAWTYDPATGEYYLHLFSPEQPDLNWENPAVRHAVHDTMRWWVERGVDGFRMDVINFISKHPELPDGRTTPGHLYGDGGAYYICGPRIHEYLAEMHVEVLAGHHLLTIGEMPGVSVEQARLFTDPARAEVDMIFTFEHVELDSGAHKFADRPRIHLPDLKRNLARWQAGLHDVGWNSLYWNNHDQPRAVSRFGDDGEHRVASAKTLGTVLHLHHGTPFVYQGEEIGMTNAGFTGIDQYRDIESIGHFAQEVSAGSDPESLLRSLASHSRDNARTPMQWDAGRNAGFTDGSAAWLPVNRNHTVVNAASQVDDPGSVFSHYQRLIRLRHDEPAVRTGTYTPIDLDHPTLFAFARTTESETLLVVASFDGAPLDVVALPDPLTGVDWVQRTEGAELLLGTHPIAGHGEGTSGQPMQLQPWESRVYRIRK